MTDDHDDDDDDALDPEYRAFMEMDGPTLTLEVVRETITPGASFSSEAMDALVTSTALWVGTRIMRRWNETNVPPTVVRVTVTVDVGG